MYFIFRRRSGPVIKKLAWFLKEYLKRRFTLPADSVEKLRCFMRDGEVLGEAVKRLYIFNPELAKEHGVTIRNNLDLEQHPEMLLFVGYLADTPHRIYLADRQTASNQVKISSENLKGVSEKEE